MVPGVADRHGVPLVPLLESAGLSVGSETFNQLIASRAQVCTLLRGLARKTGSAMIGIDLAAAAEVPQLGLLGTALLSGRTVGECLAAQARHMPCLQSGVKIEVRRGSSMASYVHRLENSDPNRAKELNEGVAAFVARAVRHIVGDAEVPMHITLPHRAQAPVGRYEERLRTAVSFVPGSDLMISFDASLLDQPNRFFGPPVEGQPIVPDPGHVPVDELDCTLDDDALHLALERIIGAAALSGVLSLPDAARTLGLSPRSLQRRLARAGPAYEVIVDRWRHRRAIGCLMDPDQPIGTVSRILGYSHPAHFVRAFHRWEAQTPSEFRDRAMAEGLARNGN